MKAIAIALVAWLCDWGTRTRTRTPWCLLPVNQLTTVMLKESELLIKAVAEPRMVACGGGGGGGYGGGGCGGGWGG
ncbi:unnamed protein product [Prunus armeniaca]|uniref:Secreted protein n=1 Tax=Prunus armeniaca TaxID=36596 RepID=A0A6J5X6M2_PRUAR|nr:unnamed protein product [Prunus armeniaca]